MAERLHKLVTATAPQLAPKTWYGMPAYTKDGKLICFFKAASKFETRYATFGFEENANLDDGSMWATSWAITKLTARRRGQDRRAREEGGELRTLRTWKGPGKSPGPLPYATNEGQSSELSPPWP